MALIRMVLHEFLIEWRLHEDWDVVILGEDDCELHDFICAGGLLAESPGHLADHDPIHAVEVGLGREVLVQRFD